jgi:hypothetical protein
VRAALIDVLRDLAGGVVAVVAVGDERRSFGLEFSESK